MKFLSLIILISLNVVLSSFAQHSRDLVYVDSSGRMRWTASGEETYFFGVNYATPFAFSYRALKNKGISHKEIIDLDVQQFKRLGLNAYRIHVWDREVSDRDGNLLYNEHIELLDYLISKLIENDIYIILTPIGWWGTGWPEPDIETPGFSTFYSKIESSIKPEAIKAHVNYLKQFVNHKNSYTGKTYKDEKYVIAFEIFNEPNLPRTADSVAYYVNTTVKALRSEGITKPIFFNISENSGKEQWEGVASSNIDGVTFQWYPTGLVKYSELKGNFLPHVLNYSIPSLTNKIKDKAKIVYEFDAADIGNSIMYPVMAHSFREAGMQWATMFCYDPTPLAQFNSEYSTHYLNFLYTPQKALGFLIAANLFTQTNVEKKDIKNSSIIMNNVLIDYENDLSVLNDYDKFYYTNSNNIAPKNINLLNHIAGFGNSDIVNYNGRGTYYLDKVDDGLWKLEVYPDAVWIRDPFGKNGLEEPVAKLLWKKHIMKITLPNLSPNFYLVKEDKSKSTMADSFKIDVEPGRYFISNDGNFKESMQEKNNMNFSKLKEFGAFITNYSSTEIKNLTPKKFYENKTGKIVSDIFSNEDDLNVSVYLKKEIWRNYKKEKMIRKNDFSYEYILPTESVKNGLLNYFITVEKGKEILTFPGKMNVSPEYWAFNPDDSYKLSILPASNKITVYDPEKDMQNIILPNIWRFTEYGIDYTFNENNEVELDVKVRRVREQFPELAMQFYIGDYLKYVPMNDNNQLELEIKKNSEGPDSILVRMIFNNSTGFERKVALNLSYEKIGIPISQSEKFNYALLPRPYPTFLPYWFESVPRADVTFENLRLESIQISVPLTEPGKELNNYGIKLKQISFLKNIEQTTSNNKTE